MAIVKGHLPVLKINCPTTASSNFDILFLKVELVMVVHQPDPDRFRKVITEPSVPLLLIFPVNVDPDNVKFRTGMNL